jgi:hypothetical protein
VVCRSHCAYTTADGELILVDDGASGSGLDRMKPPPYRFKTPPRQHDQFDDRLCCVRGAWGCLSARDASVIWRSDPNRPMDCNHGASLGEGSAAIKAYGGYATRVSLADSERRPILPGGEDHSCSSVVLTSGGLSIVAMVSGLCVRDVETGIMLWKSLRGSPPRICAGPSPANGRLFLDTASSGLLLCFEPQKWRMRTGRAAESNPAGE